MIVKSLSMGKPTMVLRVYRNVLRIIGCACTGIVVPVTLLFLKNPRQHFSRAPRNLRTGQNAVVYHLVFSQKNPKKRIKEELTAISQWLRISLNPPSPSLMAPTRQVFSSPVSTCSTDDSPGRHGHRPT